MSEIITTVAVTFVLTFLFFSNIYVNIIEDYAKIKACPVVYGDNIIWEVRK